MDALLQDLRIGWRSLRRTPGFTLVAAGTIALGIAVNTIVFSIVYSLLLRPLPFPHPGRVVFVQQTRPSRPGITMEPSLLNFLDFQDRARSFEAMGASRTLSGIVDFGGEPERLRAAAVTSELFTTLAVSPELGRPFRREENEPGKNLASVIISHRVWAEHYASDPRILGRTLRLNGRVRTIVGVMPPGFHWPVYQDIWVPLEFNLAAEKRDDYGLGTLARLRPGVNARQASAELASIMASIARENPLPGAAVSARAMTFREMALRDVGAIVVLLELAVGFVLLIACANVANLMLARAAGRRRECSLRLALGASRGRVIRQFLTESLLVAVLGGLAGVLLAHWGHRVWISMIPPETINAWIRFEIDVPVLLFSAGVTVLSALLCGLAPALHATDARLSEALREGSVQSGTSRGQHRLRAALVVVEVALSIILLAGAGLLVRSFVKTAALRSTVRTEGILTARVALPLALYPGDESRRAFVREILPRIEALPGVTGAAVVSNLPLADGSSSWDVVPEGAPAVDEDHATEVNFAVCTPGYFPLVGIPLRRGRDFTALDDSTSPRVAIVTESLARRLWPGRDALGSRLYLVPEDSLGGRTVVGIVRDVVQNAALGCDPAVVFLPHSQLALSGMNLVVRSTTEPGPLATQLRRLVQAQDPDLPLYNVRTMREHIRYSAWLPRLYVSMLSVYSVLALLIAAIGIYGVMSCSVARRTQEIGIRMALGATPDTVVRLIVGQVLRLTLIGAGIGLAGAFALTRLMTSLLYEVSPGDPVTYLGVTAILVLCAVLAVWDPARRATRVDPMTALRCE